MTECKVSHCSNEIQRHISLCEDALCAAVVHISNFSAKDFYKRVCKLLRQSVVLKFRAQLVMPFLANKLTVLLLCFQCYIQSLSAARQAMLLWTATLACLGRNTEKPQVAKNYVLAHTQQERMSAKACWSIYNEKTTKVVVIHNRNIHMTRNIPGMTSSTHILLH